MSEADFSHCVNLLRSRMTSSHAHLLALPCDIRRLIYDFYYPVNQPIHLTDGPITRHLTEQDRIRYFYRFQIPFAGLGLLRACRQINEEASAILYGQNMFFLIINETLMWQHCRNAPLWLYSLRESTRQMVKQLHVHIELPLGRPYFAGMLIDGVSDLPNLEVTIVPTTLLTRTEHFRQQRELIQICQGILKARGALTTKWNARGNYDVLEAFLEVGIIKDRVELWQQWDSCPFMSSQDTCSNQKRRMKRGEILLTAGEAIRARAIGRETMAREVEKDLCDCPLSGNPHAHVAID